MITDQQGLAIVNQVAAERPDLLQKNINSSCFEFTQIVLSRLPAEWGHIGKTAGEGQYTPPNFVPSNMTSWDGKTYFITGMSHDAIFDKVNFKQVDILGRGNDSATPIFNPDGSQMTALPQWGVIDPSFYRPNNPWVQRSGTVPVPIPPTVPVVPGREEALDEMNWLDAYYKSPEGLQRPNGLSLNGKPDFEGIAAWYLDVYQKERIKGRNRADARATYVNDIRHSDEWKQKHPGETP